MRVVCNLESVSKNEGGCSRDDGVIREECEVHSRLHNNLIESGSQISHKYSKYIQLFKNSQKSQLLTSDLNTTTHNFNRRTKSSKTNLFYSHDSCWSVLLSFLLIISVLNCTMSSPLHSSSSSSKKWEREQLWVNPCRLSSSLPHSSSSHLPSLPDSTIFRNIKTQAAKAEAHALSSYTQFKIDAIGEEVDKLEGLSYDFLSESVLMTEINKNPKPTPSLSSLNVEETLRYIYQGLQRFAVGLEAIVLDQACYGGSFYQFFNEMEFQLKYVLCEFQIGMLEKNISYDDVTREVMRAEYRDLGDKTTRFMRDWIIFRDYVQALSYVRHLFTHLETLSSSSQHQN